MKGCSVEGCDRRHEARGYCNRHYLRWLARGTTELASDMDRFFTHVEISDCWERTGCKSCYGYGKFSAENFSYPAHRWLWLQLVGPLTAEQHMDHLCRNHACVNPDHLEPVTCAENLARGYSFSALNARRTHCVNGHPFSGDNLFINNVGARVCLTCKRAIQERFLARKRAAQKVAA